MEIQDLHCWRCKRLYQAEDGIWDWDEEHDSLICRVCQIQEVEKQEAVSYPGAVLNLEAYSLTPSLQRAYQACLKVESNVICR